MFRLENRHRVRVHPHVTPCRLDFPQHGAHTASIGLRPAIRRDKPMLAHGGSASLRALKPSHLPLGLQDTLPWPRGGTGSREHSLSGPGPAHFARSDMKARQSIEKGLSTSLTAGASGRTMLLAGHCGGRGLNGFRQEVLGLSCECLRVSAYAHGNTQSVCLSVCLPACLSVCCMHACMRARRT